MTSVESRRENMWLEPRFSDGSVRQDPLEGLFKP